VGEEQSLRQTVNKQASQRRQEQQHPPSNLEEGKACNCCCVESATRGGEGHSSCKKDSNCKRPVGLYTEKQKGHASRMQQQMADNRRQVSHSLRLTFTKLSPDSPFFFSSSFGETTTSDAEGITETVLHLNLGFFFSPLMRK
jgi:hypothetical protein